MLTARPLLQLAVFIFLASTQVTAHGHKPALGRRSMGATNDVLCLQKNHSGQPQKVPPIVITGKDGRKFCGCANEMDEPVSPRSLHTPREIHAETIEQKEGYEYLECDSVWPPFGIKGQH